MAAGEVGREDHAPGCCPAEGVALGRRGVAGRRSGCVRGGGAQVGEGATVPGRGAWAPVERSGWRGAGARRRDMAAGGRLEDVSEAPSPGPAIPASCAGLRGRRLRSGSYPEPPRPGPEGTLGDGVTSGRGPQ